MCELSKKEKISICQLIVAGLCLVDLAILTFILYFPEDLRLFILQCILTATAIICILFGLSPWFYNSNHKYHRRHLRTYNVLVLWVLSILIICSSLFFYLRYMGKSVFRHFEPDIFDSNDLFLVTVGTVAGITAGVLLIMINIYITVTKLQNEKSDQSVELSS